MKTFTLDGLRSQMKFKVWVAEVRDFLRLMNKAKGCSSPSVNYEEFSRQESDKP